MTFYLFDRNSLCLEFDLEKSNTNTDKNSYQIRKLQLIDVNSLPLPLQTRVIFRDENEADQSKALKYDINRISNFLLSWIKSRQVSPKHPDAEEISQIYDNDLEKFLNMSLCRSPEDQVWIVEKEWYLNNIDEYVFENLKNTAEVQKYNEALRNRYRLESFRSPQSHVENDSAAVQKDNLDELIGILSQETERIAKKYLDRSEDMTEILCDAYHA